MVTERETTLPTPSREERAREKACDEGAIFYADLVGINKIVAAVQDHFGTQCRDEFTRKLTADLIANTREVSARVRQEAQAAALEQAAGAIDGAYNERNRLVALLARLYPSGLKRTEIEGWDPEWQGCVYIDLPTGQASWHFHDREAHLFDGLPDYSSEWDGHTTEEKYQRVGALGGKP